MLSAIKKFAYQSKNKLQEKTTIFPKNKSFFVKPKPIYINQLSDAKKENIKVFFGEIKDIEASKRFGAKDIKEFSFWSWRSCGITCIQMILKSKKKTMELVKEGLKENGYIFKKDIGWKHKVLIKIAKRNNFDGKTLKMLTPFDIAENIKNNKYIILSIVSPTGGHLILIFGFKTNNKGKIEKILLLRPSQKTKIKTAKYKP